MIRVEPGFKETAGLTDVKFICDAKYDCAVYFRYL